MIGRFSKARQRANNGGFTLIELLVVMVVLGILAGVVVFAVRGIGDKGRTEAVATEARIIRTAQEAYCARAGHYGSKEQLLGQQPARNGQTYKFLSDEPSYNQIRLHDGGATCAGTTYTVDACPSGECPPPLPKGSWAPAADLLVAAGEGVALTLPDGRVLHLGPEMMSFFDPDKGVLGRGLWTPSRFPKPPGESGMSAVLLPGSPSPECPSCGMVLVHLVQWLKYPVDDWYLFDPTNESWREVPHPNYNRPYAAPLAVLGGTRCAPHCGKALTAGGYGSESARRSTELFDPKVNLSLPEADPWTETGPLVGHHSSRWAVYTLVPLADGRAMAVNVENVDGEDRQVAQVFEAGQGEWIRMNAPAGSFDFAAWGILGDGRVLFNAGGSEIFNPAIGTEGTQWTGAARCPCSPFGIGQLLPHGGVLFTTGEIADADTAYLYSHRRDEWTLTGSVVKPRRNGVTALLRDGRVLLIGGRGADTFPTTSTEIFTP